MAKNRKRNSKASTISDRSGFRFPMREMVEEDGLLVHKSETDGQWSILKHPQNNLGRYLKGKSGDPFPVPDARPDKDWEQLTVFSGEVLTNQIIGVLVKELKTSTSDASISCETTVSVSAIKLWQAQASIESESTVSVVALEVWKAEANI